MQLEPLVVHMRKGVPQNRALKTTGPDLISEVELTFFDGVFQKAVTLTAPSPEAAQKLISQMIASLGECRVTVKASYMFTLDVGAPAQEAALPVETRAPVPAPDAAPAEDLS